MQTSYIAIRSEKKEIVDLFNNTTKMCNIGFTL